MSQGTYQQEFYRQRRAATLPAARRILGIIGEQLSWKSAVDFGCGTGTWLTVAQDLGAKRVRGYEGEWLKTEWQDDSSMDIQRVDLAMCVPDAGEYDLAISLEVAEHLPLERAASFISQLCRAAPAVLFSAAVPGQGGDGHIHERWQDYWADLFAQQGYAVDDCIRHRIWDETAIPYWYRQNCLLFVRGGQDRRVCSLNLVHPEQLLELQRRMRSPSLRDLRRGLISWLRRRITNRP